jgi:hypothetical protein
MAVWRASNFYYLQRAAAVPDQIIQQNILQSAGGPKGSKGTLRPDFLANTLPMFFKMPISPKETGRRF